VTPPPVRWGILGTGGIAASFARAVTTTSNAEVVAIGSRSQHTADAFAAAHAIPHAHASYADVLADDDVDALYIATPHPDHADWAIAAAQAGKHLLVEKPLTVHAADTDRVLDAVAASGVLLVEGYHYRFHPQTARLVSLLQEGAIGDVRMIEASFGFHAPFDPAGRLFAPELGGGGILDVGCYAVSLSVLLARACGAPVEAPALTGTAHVGSTGVDEWAAATIAFGDDLLAQVSCAVSVQLETVLRVFGADGSIHVRRPFGPDRWVGITVARRGHDVETIERDLPLGQFAIQIEHVSDLVAAGPVTTESPLMPWADSRTTMHLLDAWRSAAGVTHPA
jgi:predicted dehydrogenase